MSTFLLAACAAEQQQPVLTNAPAKKQAHATGWRTEPIIYNGRRYAVSFRNTGGSSRQVKVAAPGRKLGATRGDGRVVEQVASSTVAHFTCKSGKARVRAGSMKPVDGSWRMIVDCI